MCIDFKRITGGTLSFACMSLALTGCGDFAGKSAVGTTSSISGSAIAGPIKGATVQVYKLKEDGTQGDPIGQPVPTDGQGRYTLSFPTTGAPIMVVVKGAPGSTYQDESGNVVPFNGNESIRTVVPEVTQNQTVHVTPVTEYAVKFIQDNKAQLGSDLKQAVQAGNLVVGAKFGVDNIVELKPAVVNDANAVKASTPDQVNYGLVLAGLAKLTQEKRNGDSTATIASVVQEVMGHKASNGQVVQGDAPKLAAAIVAYLRVSGTENKSGITEIPAALNQAIANAATVAIPDSSDTTPPTAPGALDAVVGAASVKLSWNAATDNSSSISYLVYRDGTCLGKTDSTTFIDNRVQPGNSFSYLVKAVDASGNTSVFSNPKAVTLAPLQVADSQTPTQPAALAFFLVAHNSVTVSWNAASDNVAVAGYDIYRNNKVIASVGPETTRFTDASVAPFGSYRYRIEAFDAAGNRSAGNDLGIITPKDPASAVATVAAPTGLGYTATYNGVTLAWTAAPGEVAGYSIYRTGGQLVGTVRGKDSTAFSDVSVVPRTSYAYYVRAFDAVGNFSPNSTPVEVLTPVSPTQSAATLAAPTGLQVAIATSSTVALKWNATPGAVGYHIFRDGTAVGTSSLAGFSDVGVGASQTYSYRVSAFDINGNTSAASSQISATTSAPPSGDLTAPSVPASLTASASPTVVTLTWPASTDAVGVAGYEVYRNGVKIATVSAPGYADSSIVSNTSYSYFVTSFDLAGNISQGSLPASVTIAEIPQDITPPSVPGSLATTAINAGSIALAWSASTDNTAVAGYNIYRDGVQVGSTTQPFFVDKQNLAPATSYSYQVAAFDQAGNLSARSGELVATTTLITVTVTGQLDPAITGLPNFDATAPSAPAGLAATTYANNASTSTVVLSWTASSDAFGVTGYEVFRSGVKIGTVGQPGFTDSSVASGTTVTYQVLATDAAGNRSPASNLLSVTPNQVSFGVTVSGQISSAILGLPGNDVIAPAVPAGLSATSAALDSTTSSISLTWSAATDNVAVTGYAIYRNGVQISTTTQPRYSDPSVASGAAYSYAVLAYDAAGNRSALSSPISITPAQVNLNVTVGGQLTAAILGL